MKRMITYGIQNEGAFLSALMSMPWAFTLTGSRVYAGGDNSDWDFIVNPKATWDCGEILMGLLTAANDGMPPTRSEEDYVTGDESYDVGENTPFAPKDMFDGVVYVEHYGFVGGPRPPSVINLVFPRGDAEYYGWLATTQELKRRWIDCELNMDTRRNTRFHEVITQKNARVVLFKTLRECFTMEYHGWSAEKQEDRLKMVKTLLK